MLGALDAEDALAEALDAAEDADDADVGSCEGATSRTTFALNNLRGGSGGRPGEQQRSDVLIVRAKKRFEEYEKTHLEPDASHCWTTEGPRQKERLEVKTDT